MKAIQDLIKTLRSENGCPWDKKQTPSSLMVYLLEEAYELLAAIEADDVDNVMEELGDTLFQLIFIGVLYQEKEKFTLEDVVSGVIDKMIRRHPHVFGDVKADTVDEVYKNWEIIKKTEKKDETRKSVLDSIPAGIPALSKAYKISEKVGRKGFDWEDIEGVIEKVYEEWAELGGALKEKAKDDIEDEFGDLLFTLVNVARFADIHPETALAGSVSKFEKRYRYMEDKIKSSGRTLDDLSRGEIDSYWDKAKRETSNRDLL